SKLIMQTDGNLVLYNQAMHPVWFSGTSGVNPVLRVQEDGNLVAYTGSTPIWTTGTGLPLSHFDYTQYVLPNSGWMHAGQKMQTPNKKHTLYLQTDGNL